MSIDYRVGDVREQLALIPDGSVSLVASSPPFIALRSYLPDGHPHKHLEIGSEPDPAAFLDTLLALTAEWGRVLAPWGSIAIELGDTYSGNGESGHHRVNPDMADRIGSKRAEGAAMTTVRRDLAGWPRAKSLALIPQLYATSLAYGRNILRSGLSARQLLAFLDTVMAQGVPAESAVEMARKWIPEAETAQRAEFQPWLVRNVIVWARPNPAVGALGDKVRPSTSYITVATRSPKRWYDLDAVRTPGTGARPGGVPLGNVGGTDERRRLNGATSMMSDPNAAGAPPLDCWFDHHDTWTITTQPSRLAHYAMWPPKLAERLILMMCPLEVCQVCQQPRRRITGPAEYVPSATYRGGSLMADSVRVGGEGVNQWSGAAGARASVVRTAPTTGWPDCDHGQVWTPGVVLDPFCGSGTSLCVAELHGRDSIGVDLDSRNRELLEARMVECSRSLFGTQPELAGQMDLFGERTA